MYTGNRGNTANIALLRLGGAIGAGATELAGARAPQFLTAGARVAQQNLWGTCNCTKRPQIFGTPTYTNMVWH